jgi:hypothetical protein
MLQNLLRRWDFAHRGICDERRRQQLGISLNAGVDVRERGKGKGKSGLVPSYPATVPSPAQPAPMREPLEPLPRSCGNPTP